MNWLVRGRDDMTKLDTMIVFTLKIIFPSYMVASEGPSEYVRAIWPGVWQEVRKSAQVTGPEAGAGGASTAAEASKGKARV